MKQIVIVGTGMGPSSISGEGMKALGDAEVWFGASRLLELLKPFFAEKTVYPIYKPGEILEAIKNRDENSFAVLVSGDTGFYSAAAGICEALSDYEPRLIPGVSSIAYFCARLGIPWQDAALLSVHGRDLSALTGLVRRNHHTFCLTGNNAAALGEALCATGYGDITVHAGENLGSAEERIRTITARELSASDIARETPLQNARETPLQVAERTSLHIAPLSVLLFVNEAPDDRIRFGLPDEVFVRSEGIPMTKSEIRALSLAKLALRPGDICWDIGAGTGSVTVEMAMAAYRGKVYAVERQGNVLGLISQNCWAFHLGNVEPIAGEAPGGLAELPPPDAVFIGGSGGNLKEILTVILEKNSRARIVITAITLETAAAALALLPGAELTQVSAARAKKAGDSHLFIGQNPVMIISAGGWE
ncbi:precorrin-6y C5,15-methyltransferase (decarboxylating) [Treponema primitia ZAS-2]|uniref:Precorrin-6y C5,15-methyltransferase (Decarboxylating) n=1 Tax=Treponema primitia (strain ATCC BAA-887 / DSM 12427 / ZAS-2) TaxID=545694 RepID=F5YLB7_TREPZ|nr:bifunctional cobalt-precorrin-7 (C(5))-methyltransferase/cobalt-precorrin-6B (C(15))-methyltransferase [Treponema primitia]AEF86059.1 precorrin-6y C5,15-methyltransferase (decarboxylating) [Treponema primitia ZAS-2]